MRILFFILCFLLIEYNVEAQSIKKYPIGASGCAAYFFCDPGNFNVTKSQDSSEVYTGECTNENVTYGVICVKLKEKINDIGSSESMLIAYLDYLKTVLNIKQSTGYGKGHRLKGREDTRGIIDYWIDKDKANWNIKGWTDGKVITVMYGFSAKEIPVSKMNTFLDGLILP